MAEQKLRVLQVMRAPIGGLFRHVVDLSQALAERGHQVGLVVDTTRTDDQTVAKLSALAPALSLGTHAFPMPRLLGPADLTTPLRIRRLAHRLGVDVLHGHGAKGGMNARLARVSSLSGAAVYTPHGGVLHYSATTTAGKAMHAIERGLLWGTDAIIFESAFARARFEAEIAKPRCPTNIIPNGLAPAEFEPLPLGPNPYDFGFVGELRELKGLSFLLQALVAVKNTAGAPARLLVAGDGPDRAKTEQLISSLGLVGRVTLAGVLPARDIFAQSRVVVVPSLAESLPYVVLEASAAQRPVIATNVGGIPEIFGPTAGALVPPSNAAALQRAMQRTIDDPSGATAEMEVRLAHVQASFSLSRMTDLIETVYRSVMRKTRQAVFTQPSSLGG